MEDFQMQLSEQGDILVVAQQIPQTRRTKGGMKILITMRCCSNKTTTNEPSFKLTCCGQE
jgi:hypothetical protein